MSNNPVESHYVSLPRDDENLAFNGELYKSRDTKRIIFWYRGFIVCQNLAIFAIVIIIWSKYYRSHGSTCSQIVYSPAQHLLEYYPVRFSSGFGNMTTLYQAPPSNAVDEAWSDLYNGFGISEIPEEEAQRLFTRTVPNTNGQYLIGLSVFHELHCLNTLRKMLRPDYYKDPVTGAIAGIEPKELDGHISHCIDELRQSIICHSDISPIVWDRESPTSSPVPRADTIHSCRRFDKIVRWAKKHKVD